MAVALLAVAALSAADPAPRDWGQTLRQDAHALHDDLAANHPGPLNPDDPGFATRNEMQLARALKRARTAKTYADYFYAMRQYVASFDDGHLGFGVFGATPEKFEWPGFLTRFDQDGEQRVFARHVRAPVPLGARLTGCDGKSAEQVSAEIVGSIVGRWKLMSQRRAFGNMMFMHRTNPYVMHPARCTFEVAGTKRTVHLDWRPSTFEEMREKAGAGARGEPRAIELRALEDGTRWLSMSSFHGDPASPPGKALTAILDKLAAEGPAIRAAPAIVLDLRGNGGGSSDWSYQIAKHIWGEGALAAVPPRGQSVTWRASAANLESLKTGYAERSKSGRLSPETRRWFETSIAGIEGALRAGKQLWTHPPDPDLGPPPPGLPKHRLAGPVYLVTDSSCMSACLDAVDLWRSLGAVHLGQETSADTLYMEVRDAKLPSGLGGYSVPMKVYRGRRRGNNETVMPHKIFDGDIDDTAALEAWIAKL